MPRRKSRFFAIALLFGAILGLSVAHAAWAADRPNVVMLMTDDTGWGDFGAYSGGGAGLGHPTPNVDRLFHQLVWAGELHSGPRLVHHRTHSDPLGAFDSSCPR
jgi:hypothetical protein